MLINDILDLSKIEAGKLEFIFEPVNPYSLISEIKQIFALKIEEKKLDFIIDFDQEIPHSLILDEVRLRQVIFNLIGNAIKFTHDGYVKFSFKKINIENDSSIIDLLISVEDTGIGIPKDQHQLIFEAFQQQSGQSTRKYGGTGLGLSISKRLVEMMHGAISLKSEPGKGSTFEFILRDVPIGSGIEDNNEPDDFDFSHLIFSPASIMVVDDIESNRRLIIENFSTETMKVLEAEDGRKAIELAMKFMPDLIFMDIRMPVMDGFEATKIIKTNDKTGHIPVIALTASVRRQSQDKDYEKYFDGYLRKPVSRAELYREMARFLKFSQKTEIIQIAEKPSFSSKIKTNLRLSKTEKTELLHLLNEVLQKLWTEASEFQMSDGIEAFARNVKNTGEKFDFDELTKFGDDLLNYVDNFDLTKMDKSLKDYPKLIKRIKEAIKKNEE
jgi:CheY-like chemotaxis protein